MPSNQAEPPRADVSEELQYTGGRLSRQLAPQRQNREHRRTPDIVQSIAISPLELSMEL